jgi:trigger factor
VKASVEPLEGNKVKVSVEVDELEFDRAIDAAFRKISREVRIPGFRPGKAPRKVLETRLGSNVGREQAFQDALPDYYLQAVREHDVDAIAAPHIDITAGHETGPVVFDAVVEVRPVVQVPGYNGLRVTLARPAVDPSEIDAQIDRMRELDGQLEAVDRAAADGDHVSIDIRGSLDGDEQPGLTSDDYLYELGSGTVVSELDDQLRGAKVGDVFEFSATHPDADEARALTFRVLVKDVKQKVLPALDDDWAAEASDFATLHELRDDLERRMLTVRRAQAQMQLRESAAEALAALVDIEVPEPLIGAEMQNRLQDLAMRLAAQGLDLEQWVAMSGKEPDEITAELRDAAAQAVRVDLALRSVAEAEQIEVEDDDLEAEYAAVAERVGQPIDAVRSEFERAGQEQAVRSDLKKRKALEWLLERVELVDEDGNTIERADLEITPAGEADASDETEEDDR